MTMSEDLPPRATSTQQFAVEVFNELLRSIMAQEEGARNGDVEAIHDMRVAIRRLRVALSNFACCLLPEDSLGVRLQLKALADALGKVRDLDVMIEALKKMLNERPAEDH